MSGSNPKMKRETHRVAFAALLFAACGCSGGGEPAVATDRPALARNLTSARISPRELFGNTVAGVTFDRPASGGAYTYTWYRNGHVINGESDATLKPQYFGRGDRIAVEVSVPGGPGFRTPEREVLNSPPHVLAAHTTLEGHGNTVHMVVQVDARDIDNDGLRYNYRWFRNARLIDNADGPSLDMEGIETGDQIYVEVVAGDNVSQSAAFRTEVVTIENQPPRIVSEPAGASGGSFIYRVEADDPDGERLSFELLEAPAGMEIDASGVVHWTLPTGEARAGSHRVTVQVSDSGGGIATQTFTITF